jgi:glycosyltransferase involved in cell wall biosynthesis
MDESDSIFSHQIDLIKYFAANHERVTVVTHSLSNQSVDLLPENVKTILLKWKPNHNVLNIYLLYKILFLLRKEKFSCAFFHMTEVDACLSLPLLKLWGWPTVLWYAHKNLSIWLKIFHYFGNAVITSTPGSCPLNSKKIFPIGQGIDIEIFAFTPRSHLRRNKFLYLGRLDLSKNVHGIIESLIRHKEKNAEITFDVYGRPSNETYSEYLDSLVASANALFDTNWIKLNSPVARKQIPQLFENYDCLLHSFEGSLDKILLEAASCGIPVVTINSEFRLEFMGSKDNDFDINLDTFCRAEFQQITEALIYNRKIVEQNHSFKNWAFQILQILNQKSNKNV